MSLAHPLPVNQRTTGGTVLQTKGFAPRFFIMGEQRSCGTILHATNINESFIRESLDELRGGVVCSLRAATTPLLKSRRHTSMGRPFLLNNEMVPDPLRQEYYPKINSRICLLSFFFACIRSPLTHADTPKVVDTTPSNRFASPSLLHTTRHLTAKI